MLRERNAVSHSKDSRFSANRKSDTKVAQHLRKSLRKSISTCMQIYTQKGIFRLDNTDFIPEKV